MELVLDEQQLKATIGTSVADDATDEAIEEIGYQLAFENAEASGLGLSNLWEQAKIEFRILICTVDPRYKDIRDRASGLSPTQTTAFVAFVAAGLGAVIGVSATMLAPIVALLLLALTRIGKESFCNATKPANS